MIQYLITPPLAFLLLFLFLSFLVRPLRKLSYKKGQATNESKKPYACGEDDYNNLAQPDYSNFFAFAFFFTLAHAATLIMTSIPHETLKNIYLALIYLLSVIISLSILLRR